MMIGLFGKSLGHSLNIYADTHTRALHKKKKEENYFSWYLLASLAV